MAKITYPTKNTGDQFKATEANEIKASVNALYDSQENDFILNQDESPQIANLWIDGLNRSNSLISESTATVGASALNSNVSIFKVGDGTPSDSQNLFAFTKTYNINAVNAHNGLNLEITGIAQINTTGRSVRALKAVAFGNPNGFNMTDLGGGILGIEAVSRILGTGNITVVTGCYARVLHDNDITGGTTVSNAHGIVVPQHSGGINKPFGIATGIVLTEQGNTTRATNTCNLVMGTAPGIVGNLTGVFTGSWNIYAPSTFNNYFQGSILIGSSTSDSINKLQVTGSIKSTQYNLSALNTAPSSATATGTLGEIRVTSTHIYVCTATNTWVRAALATW